MDKQERGQLIRKRAQHNADWHARTVATIELLPTLDEYPQADTSDILRTYHATVETNEEAP